MIELARFARDDRVLVAAPHPDDEAIATGGVLQAARSAGAACRVLVVTDGDNNPWPQRWIEKRWHIGAADRARWGAQRRSEALAALQVLGIDAADARCLGFPDLGLTDQLMTGAPDFAAQLVSQIAEFQPTCAFLPALDDRHPDHSALHVALQLAMSGMQSPRPKLYAFGVHGEAPTDEDVVLALGAAEQATKRAAIMMHRTQMRLSRRRFLAYAGAQERYRAVTGNGELAAHPLHARVDAGALRIRIDHARFGSSLTGQSLFVVGRNSSGDVLRARVDFSSAAAEDVIDTSSGRRLDRAQIDRTSDVTIVSIPVRPDLGGAWIKLARPVPGLFVLDRFGWQGVAAA